MLCPGFVPLFSALAHVHPNFVPAGLFSSIGPACIPYSWPVGCITWPARRSISILSEIIAIPNSPCRLHFQLQPNPRARGSAQSPRFRRGVEQRARDRRPHGVRRRRRAYSQSARCSRSRATDADKPQATAAATARQQPARDGDSGGWSLRRGSYSGKRRIEPLGSDSEA